MKPAISVFMVLSFGCMFMACSKKNNEAKASLGNTSSASPATISTAKVEISADNGGYVELTGVKLSIPQGAIEENTEIRAELIEIPATGTSAKTLGRGVRLEPEGLQFLKPAEIEVCYACERLNGLNENSTMIYYQNDAGALIAIAGTVDQSRGCVRGTIEHFSSYVAAAFPLVAGNTAPNIGGANFLPATPFAGVPLRVRTTINDVNGGVTPGTVVSAFLNYRTIGALTYTRVPLLPDTTDNTVTNRYYYLIPAAEVTLAGIEYFFEATDNLNQKRTTAVQTRTVPSAATNLRFNPAGNLTIASGFKRALTLQASDGGTFRNISIENQSLSNPALGTISRITPSAVEFITAATGSGVISSTAGALTATTNTTVVAGLLNHIRITDENQVVMGGPINLLPLQTFQFDVVGFDNFGNMMPVKATFGTTGGIGSVTTLGMLTASSAPGSGTVTASFAGFNEAVPVVIDPATVVSTSPANGATNVAVNTQIQVTFSAPMDASTFNSTNMTVSDGMQAVSGSYSYAGNTVTFTPTSITYGLTYAVTLTTGIRDAIGNNLAATHAFSFSTPPLNLPSTTASPKGGAFSTPQVVTLTCQNILGGGCNRIVYTTDGSVPSFSPVNGTVVTGDTATVNAGFGDNVIKFRSENNNGFVEPYKEAIVSVSNTGFVFTGHGAGGSGISRGIGQIPGSFVKLAGGTKPRSVSFDANSGLLVAAADDGLYISTDLGVNWSRRSYEHGMVNNWFYDAVVHRGIIYAGSGGGLSISTDGGNTFVNRTISNGLADPVRSIRINAGKIIAGTDNGISISTDGGAFFATVTTANGLASNTINNVEIVGDDILAATPAGLSVSKDGGISFTTRTTANGLPTNSVLSVVVCAGRIFAGTQNGLAVSTDDGLTFTIRTTAQGLGSNRIDGLSCSGSSVYASTSNGLSVSLDAGSSFSNKQYSNGLPSNTIFRSASQGSKVFVAALGGIGVSLDGGQTFSRHVMANGFGGTVTKLRHMNGVLYAATTSGLSMSTDGGGTFVNRTMEHGLGGNYITDVFADGSKLYVSASGGGVAISSNGGASFIAKVLLGTIYNYTSTVNGVVASGSNVYVATDKGIWVSTDGGANYSQRYMTGSGYMSAIARYNGNIYAVGHFARVYSTDQGNTFSPIPTYSNGLDYDSCIFIDNGGYMAVGMSVAGALVGRATAPVQLIWYVSTLRGLASNAVMDIFAYGSVTGGGPNYYATGSGLSISTIPLDGPYQHRNQSHGMISGHVSAVVYVP